MKSGKIVLLSIGAGLIVLATTGCVLLRRHTHDPYAFLKGRSPVHVGVRGPGSWSAKEYRLYTWRQPWREVVRAAQPELTAFKKTEVPREKRLGPLVVWETGIVNGGPCGSNANLSISIEPGKALPIAESNDSADKAPEWVTVTICSNLDESWVNVIRYTFFSIPD